VSVDQTLKPIFSDRHLPQFLHHRSSTLFFPFTPLHFIEHIIMKSLPCIALAAAAVFASGNALALRPANLAGTTWTMQTNRDTVQLVIETQSGAGAPGAASCRFISGHFNISAPEIAARGWYCPATGRIHFVHFNLSTQLPVRVFTGQVSDEVIGQPLHMAGTMTVLVSAFGDLGEYNFSAVK
jgi:hypothetical protein